MYQLSKIVGRIPFTGFLKKVTLAVAAIAFVTVGGTAFSSVTGKEIPLLELKTTEAACYGSVSVSGYYRSNGTYVRSHTRSCPDSSVYNNYSYSGYGSGYGSRYSSYGSGYGSTYGSRYSSYGSGYGSGYGSSYSSYGSGYGSSYGSGYSNYGSGYGSSYGSGYSSYYRW